MSLSVGGLNHVTRWSMVYILWKTRLGIHASWLPILEKNYFGKGIWFVSQGSNHILFLLVLSVPGTVSLWTERNDRRKRIKLELVVDPTDSGSIGEFCSIQNWPRVEWTVSGDSEFSNIGVFTSVEVNCLAGMLQRRVMFEVVHERHLKFFLILNLKNP